MFAMIIGVSINPERALEADTFVGDHTLTAFDTLDLGLRCRMAAVIAEGDRPPNIVRMRSRRSGGNAFLIVEDEVS